MFENLFLKFVFQTSKTVFLRHISTKQPTDDKSTTTPTTNQSYPLEFSQQSNKENPTRSQNKEIFYYIKKKKKNIKMPILVVVFVWRNYTVGPSSLLCVRN